MENILRLLNHQPIVWKVSAVNEMSFSCTLGEYYGRHISNQIGSPLVENIANC